MEQEYIALIRDFGFFAVILIIFAGIAVKYIPKFLDLKLKRMQDRDYMMDILNKTIDNCSEVIKNNSKVIELNSHTIKNYTDNSYKLEKCFDGLAKEVSESNGLIRDALTSMEIIKERTK